MTTNYFSQAPDGFVLNETKSGYTSLALQAARAELDLLRSRNEQIKLEIKAISTQGHQRGVAALMNERKANEARIADLKEQIKALPRDMISASWLIGETLKEGKKYLTTLDAVKEDFTAKFEKDPLHTIEWYTGDLVKAVTQADLATRIIHVFMGLRPNSIVALYSLIIETVKQAQEESMREIARFSYSTSPSANMVDKFKAAALSRDGDFSGFMDVYRIESYLSIDNIVFDDGTDLNDPLVQVILEKLNLSHREYNLRHEMK